MLGEVFWVTGTDNWNIRLGGCCLAGLLDRLFLRERNLSDF